MKIFIYEHITSGALADQPLPNSLAREGDDMLHTIVHDFIQLANIELVILRDTRLAPLDTISDDPLHSCYIIDNKITFQHSFDNAIKQADAVLVIAPETNGVLNAIQQTVLSSGKQLLGCHPKATQLSSDKYHCFQHLTSQGLSSPKTIKASEWSLRPFTSSTGFIVKPRDGAGCINTLFFPNDTLLENWLISHPQLLNNTIIQEYINGLAISLNLLLSDHDALVLSLNHQHINNNNHQLTFDGCTVNGIDETQFSVNQATQLAKKIQRAITGLWGFIGIDLILTDNGAVIIDINPRLTTSYVGLHRSLKLNPAQLLLTMMEQGLSALPNITQRHAIEVLV